MAKEILFNEEARRAFRSWRRSIGKCCKKLH